jgi:predicted nucleic acid-binding protein
MGGGPQRDAAWLSGDPGRQLSLDRFFRRSQLATDLLALLLRRRILLIGDLILAEVLQGFRHQRDMDKARRALLSLPCADIVGQEVALASAMNYRLLRRRGITARKTVDVIIATFCVLNDHVLLHADRDFEPMTEYLDLRTA